VNVKIITLIAIALISGCNDKNLEYSPQMENYSYIFDFIPVKGNVASFEQTSEIENNVNSGTVKISAKFDENGCITYFKKVISAEHYNATDELIMEHDDGILSGTENGNKTSYRLNEQCEIDGKKGFISFGTYDKKGRLLSFRPTDKSLSRLKYHKDGGGASKITTVSSDGTIVNVNEKENVLFDLSLSKEDKSKHLDFDGDANNQNGEEIELSRRCKYSSGNPSECTLTSKVGGEVFTTVKTSFETKLR